MDNYKGIYFNVSKDKKFYEGGAHFRYRDLCNSLNELLMSLPNNDDNTTNEIVTPRFNQKISRNYKPPIHNLTQNLTDVSNETKETLNKIIIDTLKSVKNPKFNTYIQTKENKRNHSQNLHIKNKSYENENHNIFTGKMLHWNKNNKKFNNNSSSFGKLIPNSKNNNFSRNFNFNNIIKIGNNKKNNSYNKIKEEILKNSLNYKQIMNIKKNFMKITNNKINKKYGVIKKKISNVVNSKEKFSPKEFNLMKSTIYQKNNDMNANKMMDLNFSHNMKLNTLKEKKNCRSVNKLIKMKQNNSKSKIFLMKSPLISLNIDNTNFKKFTSQTNLLSQKNKNITTLNSNNDIDVNSDLFISQYIQSEGKLNTQIHNNGKQIIYKPKINISFVNNINQRMGKIKELKSRNKVNINIYRNLSLMKMNTTINQKGTNETFHFSQDGNKRMNTMVNKTQNKNKKDKYIDIINQSIKFNTLNANNNINNKQKRTNSNNTIKQFNIYNHYNKLKQSTKCKKSIIAQSFQKQKLDNVYNQYTYKRLNPENPPQKIKYKTLNFLKK